MHRRVAALLAVVLLIGGALMPVSFVPSTGAPTHLGRFRDPVVAEGLFSLGVPFENQSIRGLYPNARMVVQAAFGADLTADPTAWPWVDITTSVRQNDGNIVSISPMGRSDETSKAQPAGCSFVLDNRTGDFTAYHPASRYYPYVRRNTPVRVLVNLTGDPVDTSTRFFGYANGWEPGWEVTNSEEIAVVTVSASGVTRRLGQGKTPLKSAATRFFQTQTGSGGPPLAYWPLEDPPGSLSGASGLPGGQPMTASGQGANSPGVEFGKGVGRAQPPYTGFEIVAPATGPLASLGQGGKLSGRVPQSTKTPVAWTVTFMGRIWAPTLANDVTLARWTTPGGTYVRWDVRQDFGSGIISLIGVDNTGGETVLVTTVSAPIDLVMYRVYARQNGANFDYVLDVAITNTVAGEQVYGQNSASTAGTLRPVDEWFGNPDRQVVAADPISGSENLTNDIVVGQVSVWDFYGSGGSAGIGPPRITRAPQNVVTGNFVSAWTGYVGETATDRLQRLCRQEGLPLELAGTSATTMGAQSIDTLLNLLRECETADGGVLFDGLAAGVGYIARTTIYNQAAAVTVAAGDAKLGVPFGPTDNDQRNRNQITAKRKGGSQATYEDVDGPLGTNAIGLYDSTIPGDLNLDDDDPLIQHAAWAVHLGTVEGFRYPSLSFDFRATPELAEHWLAVRPVSLFDVTSLETVFVQHPPGDLALLGEGWSEQVSPYIWKATVNCSPGAPWAVAVLDDDKRLDCGASVTSGEHNTTTTSLNLGISDVCTWTHADGDYTIVAAGELMTVTAVGAPSGSGTSWTQTLTVTRSVNGIVKAHPAGTPVHVAEPLILAL